MRRLPFIPDQIYKRSAIQDQYGGNRQGGICPCSAFPYIFIFSGPGGHLHGYKDEWLNIHVFSYSGEGQIGDMKFTRGNLALRDHLKNEKRVFLFEYIQRGWVRFVSELELFDVGDFVAHDRNGVLRTGIKFFFKRAGAKLYINPDQLGKSMAKDVIEFLVPNVTERSGLVTSRVGQGAYRKSILHRWEYRCAVTNFNDPRILIASHIVPWRDSTDLQRLDVDNGILLSPTYDALFDKHLVTFDNNGKIVLSDQIEMASYRKVGVSGKENLHMINEGIKAYLEIHQMRFGERR